MPGHVDESDICGQILTSFMTFPGPPFVAAEFHWHQSQTIVVGAPQLHNMVALAYPSVHISSS